VAQPLPDTQASQEDGRSLDALLRLPWWSEHDERLGAEHEAHRLAFGLAQHALEVEGFLEVPQALLRPTGGSSVQPRKARGVPTKSRLALTCN
jgi:hypothetical protein